MRRLPALVAALLLPAASPVLLVTTAFTGALLVSQAPAQAQSAEAVAKVAQAITVRIEGATQGSGVLVKRDGNRYTVLTAWHVVSAQRPGEELDIYTPDGQRHQLEQGSIKRLGEVDMAVLTFASSVSYEVASIGDVKSVSIGSPIFVGGFPLPTSAVPSKIFRFKEGRVEANATVTIPNGYQLLYSNPTLPGMSGGAVMNARGELVGIHGQGETDSKMSEQQGVAVKTGTNQAVPIAYYSHYSSGAAAGAVVASSPQVTTADDYLAQAASILSKGLRDGNKRSDNEMIKIVQLTTAAIGVNPKIALAYALRSRIIFGDRGAEDAIADANQAISLDGNSWNAFIGRGNAKYLLGDKQGAIADYNQALAINPQCAAAYYNRGNAKHDLGDKQGAIADYNQALAINPQDAAAYYNRGITKHYLGDKQGAIADYNQALAINPKIDNAYRNRGKAKYDLGDKIGACGDYRKAISLGSQEMAKWLQSDSGAWCRDIP